MCGDRNSNKKKMSDRTSIYNTGWENTKHYNTAQ